MSRSDAAGTLFRVLLCALVACDGDDGGSGVDSNKTLDAVTSDEAMDLCIWELDMVEDDFVRFFCFLEAIEESQEEPDADCEILAQECIDDPSADFDGERRCEVDPEKFDDLPACASEVTVGELENCIDALAAVLADLADRISCESIPVPDSSPPVACLDLEERCPRLFDFSDDDRLTGMR